MYLQMHLTCVLSFQQSRQVGCGLRILLIVICHQVVCIVCDNRHPHSECHTAKFQDIFLHSHSSVLVVFTTDKALLLLTVRKHKYNLHELLIAEHVVETSPEQCIHSRVNHPKISSLKSVYTYFLYDDSEASISIAQRTQN